MSDPVRAKLLARIGTSGDVATLRGLRDQIHEHMEALLSKQPIEQFYTDLNEVHDALISRAVALSEEQMARMGHGSPPVPYAYLLFGSGGREEQTLTSDQDSGLIYADPSDPSQLAAVAHYFETFTQLVVHTLQELGYPPCDGEVVSSNSMWCQSLTEWKTKLDQWFAEPDWERVRYLLIIADCRIVSGLPSLWMALKEHFFSNMHAYGQIVENMLNNTLRHKVLVGVFGQLFKEHYGEDAGSLDLKYGAYIPMVNSVRLLALLSGIRETATITRIEQLTKQGVFAETESSVYISVFRLFIRLRLLTTVKMEDGFYTNNGMLSNSRLTKELIEELKAGLRIVKRLQRLVRKRAKRRF